MTKKTENLPKNKTQENENLKHQIIEALKEVYDPEIPINVYDLGLIYEIHPNAQTGNIHITMSLTSPTCPTAEYIQEMISNAVESVKGVKTVEIKLTFEPRWTPDRVSDYAKEELGIDSTQNQLQNQINTTIPNIFNNETSSKQIICKKCLIPNEKTPLIKTLYKNQDEYFCFKCLQKIK